MALGCLGASLALTPLLGLDGLVLGTAIPYAVAFPFFMRFVLRKLPVSLGDLARRAWLPAYPLAAVLALMLVAAFGVIPATVGALLQEVVDLVTILAALRAIGGRRDAKAAGQADAATGGVVEESTFLGSIRRTLVKTDAGDLVRVQHDAHQHPAFGDRVWLAVEPVPVAVRPRG